MIVTEAILLTKSHLNLCIEPTSCEQWGLLDRLKTKPTKQSSNYKSLQVCAILPLV